jgi:protein TonB
MTEAPSSRFLIKKVEPDYPNDAKAAGVEGDVVFRIIIGTDGRVQEIHLRRGKPLLIKAAAKAVSKWQYRPYMFNGNAVEVETFATVRFPLPSKHE